MQLDNKQLQKDLSPDEREILLTFKKSPKSFKEETNGLAIAIVVAFSIVLVGLVFHFTGILNAKSSLTVDNDIFKLVDSVVMNQQTLVAENQGLLNEQERLKALENNLEQQVDKLLEKQVAETEELNSFKLLNFSENHVSPQHQALIQLDEELWNTKDDGLKAQKPQQKLAAQQHETKQPEHIIAKQEHVTKQPEPVIAKQEVIQPKKEPVARHAPEPISNEQVIYSSHSNDEKAKSSKDTKKEEVISTNDLKVKVISEENKKETATHKIVSENKGQETQKNVVEKVDEVAPKEKVVAQKQEKEIAAPKKGKTQVEIQPENNDPKLIDYSKDDLHHVQKPQIDNKSYRYIELPNKLKVLLIHDKNAKVAQAALNVLAGSWDEPNEYPGLAHFLEHMLFQGSATFPDSGYFEKLVASAGGSTNAYTQGTKTNYYFSIGNKDFYSALETFSHFFIDPLLSESMVDKEVNAVNSEYEIDVSGDGWKLMHLITLLADENHPLSRFTIGNNESLNKKDIVKALREFHESHYSANLMALVVKSSHKLDDMQEWIEGSDFTKIVDKDLPKPDYNTLGYPLRNKHLGSVIKYHVNSHSKSMIFAYQIDDVQRFYETKPMEFIDAIVQSKHESGLYSYLIKQGLAVDLDAGTFMEGNGAFTIYLIQVILPETEKSQEEYQGLLLSQAITAYFDEMMNQFFEKAEDGNMKASKLLMEMWAEKQALGDVGFRFLEDSASSPLSNIFHLSHNLNSYPPNEVLSADFLLKEFDGKPIYNFLVDLLNPGNLIVMIGDNDYYFQSETKPEVKAAPEVSEDKTSLISYLDTSSQFYEKVQDISLSQLKKTEKGSEDLAFIVDRKLTKRNVLYRIDWDIKKLSQDTLDFIAEPIDTKNLNFTPIDAAQDQDIMHQLKLMQLPQVNNYVPRDLSMKSLCRESTKSNQKLRATQVPQVSMLQYSPHKIRQETVYSHLPKDQSEDDLLESNELYRQKLQSFVQVQEQNQYYYTSMEDCLNHERQYELDNIFPHLIKKDLEGRAWWKMQRSFNVPAIFAGVKFDTAINMKTLRQESLLQVFNQYISDALHEKLEQSFEAGFKLGFDSSMRGVTMEMFGWSDKFEDFYTQVLKTLKGDEVQDKEMKEQGRVDRAKASLLTDYQNTYERKLYIQASSTFFPMIMQSNFQTAEAFQQELSTLQYSDVIQFRNEMMKNFRFTTLFAGNILRDEADVLVQRVRDVFQETTSHIQIDNHLVRVANTHGKAITIPFVSRSTDKADLNGVTLNYYLIGQRDQKEFAIMNILQGTFQNKAYNYLRTELQLGYVVSARFRPTACMDGASVLVQGTAQPPYVVNQHIEDFLKLFGDYLEKMDDQEFQSIKDGALSRLKENVKSLQEEATFMWDHIKFSDLAFEEKQIAASIIDQIKKEELSKFYTKVFRSADTTGKISLQIYGKGMIEQSMGLKDQAEFDSLIQKTINENQHNYSGVREQIAFNEIHFRSLIRSDYNCNYRISNI